MRISKEIKEKILTDNEFSLELAKQVNKSQATVKAQAARLSRELLSWNSIEYYAKQGYTIDQVFNRPITTLFKLK